MATTSSPPNADAPPPDPTQAQYDYLFLADKTPTPVFTAFLYAMAQYIIDNFGDKNDKTLSSPKLAVFYKAVGADYDSLFVESPNESISYIWQITGCQHSLQPTDDDFAPPTIPALTPKGFVRWQSVETLLCPNVHVPLLQLVAKQWHLKNLTTGELFPAELPKEALPSLPDPEVEKWHDQCANKLRREASMADEMSSKKARAMDDPPSPKTTIPRPAFKTSTHHHAHTRTESPGSPPNQPRNMSPQSTDGSPGVDDPRAHLFSHVPARHIPPASAAAELFAATAAATAARAWTRRVRLSPPEDETQRVRRRSFSDYPSNGREGVKTRTHSPPVLSHGRTGKAGVRIDQQRRHSHPRHRPSSSDSSSDSDDGGDELPAVRPKYPRRAHRSDDPPLTSVRRVYPPHGSHGPTGLTDTYSPGFVPSGKRESSSSGPDRRRRDERVNIAPQGRSPHQSPHRSPHRPPHPGDESRPRGFSVAGEIRDKLASILPNGVLGAKPQRPRSLSRPQSRNTGMGAIPPRYSKESLQGSRLGRSWSYDSDEGDDTSLGTGSSRHARDKDRKQRDRDHDRERERARRDRDDDRDYIARREREQERSHDHAEYGHRLRDKDRERDRERDRDRDRGRDIRDLERDRDREAPYIRTRGPPETTREKRKTKSLDRSRDRERGANRVDREDDREREHRIRRERERDRDRDRGRGDRDRHLLRSEPLKRPLSTADMGREW
ncbi:hypothetical protein SEPCBS57363_005690 [Sporothrix epigloea]|uniref:DUF7514 domain-containing protein n=1 Tax=Sporothrix epigloea TaxID=1892477 RepID=A0ABP0DYY0_9PEZI